MTELENLDDEEIEVSELPANNKAKILIIGTAVGALTGLAAAFLFSRRAVKSDGEVTLTPTEGLKIGLLVVGLLRSVATLGGDDK
jgi:hypothetical protein